MSDNDWLKYNASEYTVNGVTYRNLEAQVLKNKEDIEAIDVSGLENDVEQLQTDVGSLGDDIDALESGKQDKLTAGSNITISGTTISATDTTYDAGTGIDITDGTISSTVQGIPSGGTTGQALCKTSGTDYAVSWQTVGGGGASFNTLTITLDRLNWTSNTQTVTVVGMTSTAIVWVSPIGATIDITYYSKAQIYCSAQGTDSLTFYAVDQFEAENATISVNVVWTE